MFTCLTQLKIDFTVSKWDIFISLTINKRCHELNECVVWLNPLIRHYYDLFRSPISKINSTCSTGSLMKWIKLIFICFHFGLGNSILWLIHTHNTMRRWMWKWVIEFIRMNIGYVLWEFEQVNTLNALDSVTPSNLFPSLVNSQPFFEDGLIEWI